MNEDLLRFNDKAVYCVFDFEAESLNLWYSKPWQFACIIGTKNKILRKHDIYIDWPDLNLSKDAHDITHFDENKWRQNKISANEAFNIINREFADANIIGGHNLIGYDLHIYRNSCLKLEKEILPIQQKLYDTCPIVKGIKLEIPYKKGEDFFQYQLRLHHKIVAKRGFASLGGACKLFEVEVDPSKQHDALYDVSINYEVLKKSLWKVDI